MTRFILATFFFLAVAFYELSGGAGFVPDVQVARVDAVETVTRADTVALTQVAAPAVTDTLTVPLIAPEVALAPEAIAAPQVAVVETAIDDVIEQVIQEPAADLRVVNAERVNVREGPGTDYAVVDRLVQGTATEVLETDASGWAHVRVIDTGLLGWVSAEYLAAQNG